MNYEYIVSNTYSSLTDINGADVFTNSYKARVEKFEKEQKEADKEFGDAVFVKEPNEDIDIEQQVREQIFTGTTTQVQKEIVINDTGGNELLIPIVGIIFVVMFIIAIQDFTRQNKDTITDMYYAPIGAYYLCYDEIQNGIRNAENKGRKSKLNVVK